jgi:hypothetical protein
MANLFKPQHQQGGARRLPCLLLLAAGAAAAQTGAFSGPVAGYVFDAAAQSLRPVLGIPGASTLGPAIDAGYSFSAAYVAPRQDSFIGIATDGSTHFFGIASGAISEKSVAGLAASPARVVFSPSGTAAALYVNGQAQILTGLPASPALSGSMTLTQPEPRPGRHLAPALALSDDGAYLLAARGGSIQLAGGNGVVRPVMQTGADAVFAFAPGGYDAAVAARGSGLLLIHDVPNGAAQQVLASDDASLTASVGIAFSGDGTRVFLASVSQSVSAFDLSGNRSSFSCACAPAELTPMGAAFRLTELSAGPLWLLDAGAVSPRLVFVPALRAAQ